MYVYYCKLTEGLEKLQASMHYENQAYTIYLINYIAELQTNNQSRGKEEQQIEAIDSFINLF